MDPMDPATLINIAHSNGSGSASSNTGTSLGGYGSDSTARRSSYANDISRSSFNHQSSCSTDTDSRCKYLDKFITTVQSHSCDSWGNDSASKRW